MSGPNDKDRSLDEYLRGDSPVSRAYREEAQELPPAHLDARILAEANRAGTAAKRVAKSPFSSYWMVPASLAAVLVLAVSVVALLQFEPEKFDYAPEYPIESKTRAKPARQPVDRAAPAESPDAAVYSAPVPAFEKLEKMDELPATAASVPPRGNLITGGGLIREQSAAPRISEDALQQAPYPATAPSPQLLPAPAGAMRDDDTKETDQGKKSKARKESYLRLRSVEAEASKREARAGTAAGRAQAQAIDAEAWLARIEALIAEGSLEEAAAQLRELRALHPEVEIPGAILSRLGDAAR